MRRNTKVSDLADDEAIESIALTLANAIYNNDTRWIRQQLVEFAKEVISQSQKGMHRDNINPKRK